MDGVTQSNVALKASEPVLSVSGLARRFPLKKGLFSRISGYIHAVDGVSFDLAAGETLALVGESGCGKSTTGRCVVQLDRADEGSVRFGSQLISALSGKALKAVRAGLQMVFQDPNAALTSHMRIGDQLAEPLRFLTGLKDSAELSRRVEALLQRVGLDAHDAMKYPHEFSGGQKQRVCIARALACEPSVIVCDEAVSALDVSIKAQIINLLIDLQETDGVALLFISHDLGIVESISHRVAVMYLGRIVEVGPTSVVFDAPAHPYTEALLATAPDLLIANTKPRLKGAVPSASDRPSGCHFHPRCPIASEPCTTEVPALRSLPGGRQLACHHRLTGSE